MRRIPLAILILVPAAAEAPQGRPELISETSQYDGQPAVVLDSKGLPWVAWVGFSKDKGDQIFCAHRAESGWSAPIAVTSKAGNYVRPAIACLADDVCVFWTATTEEKTSIWMARHTGGRWSAPARVSPDEGYHQNPEACVDGRGNLWLVWQGCRTSGYDIYLASFDGARWSAPIPVTEQPGNDWDPSIAADSAGKLWIAWSSFRDADYDAYLVSVTDGTVSDERRLSDHGAYDLHPWVTVDARDRVWLAWDRISVGGHGDSGHTGPNAGADGGFRAEGDIVVRCLEDGRLKQPKKSLPDLPKGYTLQHCGYPKIVVDRSGTVHLFHRALTHSARGPKRRRQGPMSGDYWWDVVAYRYEADPWTTPEILEKSDGYLEEPSACASADALWVVYQMEHRMAPEEDDDDDHHVGMKPLGENGEIYVSRRPIGGAAAPALKDSLPLAADPSALSKRLAPRAAAQHEVESQGAKYRLLFGDTHKHSNISRCSSGTEPSLDDHYRYAHDVCRYDFMTMSDHSQHTTDFNWWKLQKSADLYYIPGFFVTLFGYEASQKWPIGHRNVLFAARPAPIVRPSLDGTKTAVDIWKKLQGVPAITIPHTSADPGMGTNWKDHDPQFERLVEIFQSCRGSYEHDGCPRQHKNATAKGGYVQDALAKGYRLGIIGSSDHGSGVAYAAVYAKSLTREDVFEALHARRCYGSTAYGIVLDVRADGHWMGEEFSTDRPVAVTAFVRGYANVRSVELIRDGKVVRAWKVGKPEAKLEWSEEEAPKGTRYYYVRVILEDEEMAWSSPIWATRP